MQKSILAVGVIMLLSTTSAMAQQREVPHVHFGSQADICGAKSDVRFGPQQRPRKRTCAVQTEMSAKGQSRTWARCQGCAREAAK
jgi:hypothetical protein